MEHLAESFDVVIMQAMLYEPSVLVPLGADGGCFVDRIRRSEPGWSQWTSVGPEVADRLRGFERGGVLRSLAFVTKADFALCERVHNHQSASDLGLDAFWEDEKATGIRLVSRSYSLVATNFGQFVLALCFRFVGGTPESRSDAIRHMCENRAIRANIGQLEYSRRAIQYANDEIERVFRSLQLECSESTFMSRMVASPSIHGRLDWIRDDDDLTAFPWFLTGPLTERAIDILADQSLTDEEHAYHQPSTGKPLCIIGNDFGFYCEADERRPMRLELLPLFLFSQASYYKTRQLQDQLVSEMGRAVHLKDAPDAELRAVSVDHLALSFDRFMLAHTLFFDSRIDKIRSVADRMHLRWRTRVSQERLAASIERHRQHAESLHRARVHSDSARQETILFVIAILQLFALISVVADYRQINPSLGDAARVHGWAIERWLFQLSPWLPRVLCATALGVACWHFAPAIRRWLARRQKSPLGVGQVRTESGLIDPGVDPNNVDIRPSPLHGRGLWTTRPFRSCETIIEYSGGDVFEFLPSDDTARECWNEEWNATEGKLHIRRGRGTPYRFINHSRDPNAVVKFDAVENRFQVQALRDILSREEILLDYRDEPLPRRYLIDRGGYL